MPKADRNPTRPPAFRPPLCGCVPHDRRMSNALIPLYINAFSSLAANIYRSLVCRGKDSRAEALFEELAEEDLEEFRLLGELILSLGGDAELRGTRAARHGYARAEQDVQDGLLREALDERRLGMERYQAVLGESRDRVVRSVLTKLLTAKAHSVDQIEGFLKC